MEKEMLLETEIPREKGYLYYTKTNEKGNITLWRVSTDKRKNLNTY